MAKWDIKKAHADVKWHEYKDAVVNKLEDLAHADVKLHEYDDYDTVEQPQHYNQSGIECIVAIEAMTESMSPRVAPHAANVLKYLWRHEYKNGVEDLDKAMWYLRRLRGRYVGEEG